MGNPEPGRVIARHRQDQDRYIDLRVIHVDSETHASPAERSDDLVFNLAVPVLAGAARHRWLVWGGVSRFSRSWYEEPLRQEPLGQTGNAAKPPGR